MTNREFYSAIISNSINADVLAHAQASLDALDSRNAKRNAVTNAKRAELNAPIIAKMMDLLSANGTPMLSSDIASAIGETTSKVVGVASTLRNQGTLDSVKIKVKGKGEQTAWFIVSKEN